MGPALSSIHYTSLTLVLPLSAGHPAKVLFSVARAENEINKTSSWRFLHLTKQFLISRFYFGAHCLCLESRDGFGSRLRPTRSDSFSPAVLF